MPSGFPIIAALGDRLTEVAEFHGKSPRQLREMFRKDDTLWINPRGSLYLGDFNSTHAFTLASSDDVANGVEYVFGGLAGVNDLAKLPVFSSTGGNLFFTFVRNQASIDDVSIVEIEVGENLTDWSATYTVPGVEVANTPGVTVRKNDPESGKDTVMLTLPLSAPKIFARLKVTP